MQIRVVMLLQDSLRPPQTWAFTTKFFLQQRLLDAQSAIIPKIQLPNAANMPRLQEHPLPNLLTAPIHCLHCTIFKMSNLKDFIAPFSNQHFL